jgi:membrane associated rhomboid family serine protease
MAFRSNGPVMLALPPFRGATRRLILIALGVFFAILVMALIAPDTTPLLVDHSMLHPDQVAHGQVWQLVTYPFPSTLLSLLFTLLSIWFFGSALEDDRGSRWFVEYFLAATVGGGLVATLVAYAVGGHIPGIDAGQRAAGLWPLVMAILLAYARFNPEQQINLMLVLQVKAKHVAAIYLLLYLAIALSGGDRFGAVVALANALCGYAYLRFAPRMGLRAGVSERWFGLRNAYYRWKRQRSAKKFKVYMSRQGKDVNIDSSGRYVDSEGKPRDPNDKRWMN